MWMKKRRQLELQEKMERGWVAGEGEEMKVMVPPEVPAPKKITLPKDMPEHLCLAAWTQTACAAVRLNPRQKEDT